MDYNIQGEGSASLSASLSAQFEQTNKLCGQTVPQFDDICFFRRDVSKFEGGDLSVEERNLLSVAYKNAVGSRRASWRIISSVEQKETQKSNSEAATRAAQYRVKVEKELDEICRGVMLARGRFFWRGLWRREGSSSRGQHSHILTKKFSV